MKKQQANSAAIYCRLSRDDGNDAESNSIGTQKAMLQRYAKEHGFTVYGEYIDDGFTGTSFDRPDFKRMITDIEAGNIGVVLCKDLSRFGRNNALVAYYTEIVFPDNDVRFVAVNDAIDTAMGDSGGNAVMPFMSVVNEYYARDISKKVRSARRTRALNGEHCSGRTAFGYLKNPEDKHKLVIDDETADIVRQIFQMAADGLGHYQIMYRLANAKIKCPSAWEYERTGKLGKYYDPAFPWNWNTRTIASILHNKIYLGHMVSHRQMSKSFKSKKIVNVPEDEWIIVENTHPAIVSQEIFDKVAAATKVKKRENTSGVTNIFAGLLVCADCNKHLTFNHNTKHAKRYVYFNCDSYRHGPRTGDARLCTPHHITWDNLTALMKMYIKMAVGASLDIDAFVKSLLDRPDDDAVNKRTADRLRKRENELKILTKKVFEQNALGRIDDNTFAELYSGYQTEQQEIAAKLAAYESRISESRNKEEGARRFAETTSKYIGAEELTRDMLLDLIDKVVIHEASGGRGEKREQEVDIYFRFIGKLPDSLVSL